ncbi:hypothetical protein [Alkalicoccobacillus murimartini]|uniref:Uncharacterized protein n=1 Tax=Alkalicoccobacillus murimartini TaxID=171685 RepID=A0ABT9YIF4_9BACI|nr:hypothetical protein [Alkalicoccobacillus murimartini]MDQ0207640.1 hypothetical protein [Alkalicoccobacillus murimartini]
MDKNQLIEEVVQKMDDRINSGIRSTTLQERDDLKQDILLRLVKVTHEMETISFWTFKKKYDEGKKSL